MSARADLVREQSDRFDRLAHTLMRQNRFYSEKFGTLGFSESRPPTFTDLPRLPFTDKQELAEDQLAHPPYGTNLTHPLPAYVRLHQTSGTTGAPLRWLDTRASWNWILGCWERVFAAAGVKSPDRVFCAFSFGPFLGFWAGFEAAQRLGIMALAGGALNTEQRLEHLLEHRATVLLSTPTYGLHLAEVAGERGIDLASSSVRLAIQAGEPGASVPNVRRRLEEAWGARVVDHAGATEVGPWGFACGIADHMHVNEEEFVVELLDPASGEPVGPDVESAKGELVLTNLGRDGSPVIRYRTGDLVELQRSPCACGSPCLYLEGGILSRLDDMIIVRGVNVYPSTIENVIRQFPEVVEFEVRVSERAGMSELTLLLEPAAGEGGALASAVARALRNHLSLRVQVETVAAGSLPRYELKARRFKFV